MRTICWSNLWDDGEIFWSDIRATEFPRPWMNINCMPVVSYASAIQHKNITSIILILCTIWSLISFSMGSKTLAAIFSNTKGRTSHAIHDEKSRPTARVASYRLWRVHRLLVWTHQPHYLPCDLQESPSMGISHQTTHQKQVCNSPTLMPTYCAHNIITNSQNYQNLSTDRYICAHSLFS